MNSRLFVPTMTLRVALGLMATLAGLDKFFNLLTNWEAYIAPVALHLSPVSPHVLMGVIGIVEFAVGLTILLLRPSIGCYVASLWLLLVAANLVLGGHFDVAVRDVVISIAAFTAARLLEVQQIDDAREGHRVNPAFATGLSRG